MVICLAPRKRPTINTWPDKEPIFRTVIVTSLRVRCLRSFLKWLLRTPWCQTKMLGRDLAWTLSLSWKIQTMRRNLWITADRRWTLPKIAMASLKWSKTTAEHLTRVHWMLTIMLIKTLYSEALLEIICNRQKHWTAFRVRELLQLVDKAHFLVINLKEKITRVKTIVELSLRKKIRCIRIRILKITADIEALSQVREPCSQIDHFPAQRHFHNSTNAYIWNRNPLVVLISICIRWILLKCLRTSSDIPRMFLKLISKEYRFRIIW